MIIRTEYAKLYMDTQLNHSSGYFTDADMSLDSAQRAKTDAVLRSCRIRPSMRLLDIGCGCRGDYLVFRGTECCRRCNLGH